jgi:hypothetical protein
MLLLPVALLLLGAALYFRSVAQGVLDRAAPGLAGQLEYRDLRVTLGGGIEIKELRLRPGGALQGMELDIPQVRGRLELASLLRRTPRLRELWGSSLTVRWPTSASPLRDPALLTRALGEITGLEEWTYLRGGRLRFETITLISGKDTLHRIEEVSLAPRATQATEPFTLACRFGTAHLRPFPDRPSEALPRLREMTGDLLLSPQRIEWRDLSVLALEGKVEGRFLMNLRPGLPMDLQSRLHSLSLERSLSYLIEHPWRLGGELEGTMLFRGELLRRSSLVGSGKLALLSPTLEGTALQASPLLRKRAPQFSRVAFKRVDIGRVDLGPQGLNWSGMEGVGSQFDFSSEGKATPRGEFALGMRARIHKSTADALPNLTRMALEPLPDGDRGVKLRLAGDLQRQEIVNQQNLMKRGVGNTLRSIFSGSF